ncbi:hypothetical protein HALLA_04105 (plasmid) [Halostagnicola larsenii XH-48]|uniref:Uncharacterized protein n=1 Tax=Halostagnicola larsenii XH-48 TaxID=797299 RepID=W0JX11_9EURY|nr:hypothetical protein [Halostagnicola larsenii]AHG01588.1 hypothetical protein HALLA_04105 [Halostagnicola larsenii XH-48]
MTGLKSGSGDDLWGDDTETTDDTDQDTESTEADRSDERTSASGRSDRASSSADSPAEEASATASTSGGSSESSRERSTTTSESRTQGEQSHSYIVRRAIQDKSVQFERDERLTFFVHDDVIEGERDLITELESTLGRDVPKFDVREAVYRAALRNQDDVLEELLSMGYSQE